MNASSSFTLGPPAGDLPGDEEEAPLALPNAIEIGEAVRIGSRFAVSYLAESGGETHAKLAMLSAEADAGHAVDLGRVFGAPPPPRIAPAGTAALVAIADGDVNESAVRVARVEGDLAESRVTDGARIPQGNDESNVFSLAAGSEKALLVWDQWDQKGRGEILALVLDIATLAPVGEPRRLSREGADAETPRVVSDSAGFWAAWVENAPLDPKEERKKVDEDTAPGVALGPRWVQIVRLDSSGASRGAPVQVGSENGMALGFDLVPIAEGALVVWRDDATSPATPGGRLLSARARDDGTVERGAVTEEDIGAGDPLLLFGGAGRDLRWLVFPAEDDALRMAAVDSTGRIAEPVREEALRRGMPLAAADDRLLVATPRGKSVELTVLRCR